MEKRGLLRGLSSLGSMRTSSMSSLRRGVASRRAAEMAWMLEKLNAVSHLRRSFPVYTLSTSICSGSLPLKVHSLLNPVPYLLEDR